MDFPFVLKHKQLDYSACHFMQHVFILLAFKVFPLWMELLEYLLVIFNRWWLSFVRTGHTPHCNEGETSQRGFTGSWLEVWVLDRIFSSLSTKKSGKREKREPGLEENQELRCELRTSSALGTPFVLGYLKWAQQLIVAKKTVYYKAKSQSPKPMLSLV